MKLLLLVAIPALVVWSACGTPSTRRPRHRPEIVLADELANTRAMSAYEATRNVRPQWFVGGRAVRVVILHDRIIGSLESLRQFSTREIESLRYLSDSDTYSRYGRNGPSLILEIRYVER